MPPVFISYCWQQGDWVWNRLVPVLKAAGGEILYDREQFEAARALKKQMDDLQDRADLTLMVLSPDYLTSKACQHEMKRAIAKDPNFTTGVAVPILRVDCPLPKSIKQPNPLRIDLSDDAKPDPWDLLLKKCQLDLGIAAPDWLRAHDQVLRHLNRNESVNLIVTGAVKWDALIDHLRSNTTLSLAVIHLDSPGTMSRRSLVHEILTQCGCSPFVAVPDKPEDLVLLGQTLGALKKAPRLALTSFDLVAHRRAHYESDLFVALLHLVGRTRKLILLITSRMPFAKLLPADLPVHPCDPYSYNNIWTVELKGKQ